MRRNSKRFLSLLLALAMVFTLFTNSIYAEEDSNGSGSSEEVVSGSAIEVETTAEETSEEEKTNTGSSSSSGSASAGLMAVSLTAENETESTTEAAAEANEVSTVVLVEISGEETTAYYESLAEAVSAVTDSSEATITLLSDTESSSITISESQDIILDLGGHTLTFTGGTSSTIASGSVNSALINNGTLTIKNGKVTRTSNVVVMNTGALTVESDASITGKLPLYNVNGTVNTSGTITGSGNALTTFGGTVNITDGTVETTGTSSYYAIAIFNSAYDSDAEDATAAEVNISGGEVNAENAVCIGSNCVRSGESNLTITGGTLTGAYACIYWPSAGTITIGTEGSSSNDSPKLTNTYGSAIGICCGTLNVYSGTIECTITSDTWSSLNLSAPLASSAYASYLRSSSGMLGLGEAISIYANRSSAYAEYGLTVNLYGGVFTSASSYAVRYMDCNVYDDTTDQTVSVNLSGGTYVGGTGASGQSVSAVDASYVSSEDQAIITGGTYLVTTNEGTAADTTVSSYLASGLEVDSTTGVVSDGKVASVTTDGTTSYYASLAAAVDAVTDGSTATITMLADSTESTYTYVSNSKNVTLDLNGYTVDLGSNSLYVEGTLTIKDSTASSDPTVGTDYNVSYTSGKITSTTTTVDVYNGGSVTLESGTVESTGYDAFSSEGDTSGLTSINTVVTINGGYVVSLENSILVKGKGATANINGGVLEAKDNAVVAGNGSNSGNKIYGGTIITMTGGTLIGHIESEGYVACGIYHPQEGTLTISGGTIYADGGCGILMRGGDLSMTGGTIITTETSDGESGKVGDSRVVVNSSGIIYDLDSGYYDVEGVSISLSDNVTISAASGSDAVYVVDSSDAYTSGISISGGTYSSDVSDYCVDGYTATENSEGVYTIETVTYVVSLTVNGETTYYTSLGAAIAAVPVGTSESDLGTAATITLLQDITDAEGVSIPSYVNLTIDFANHNYVITGPGAGSANTQTQGFQLLKGSTIVMKNGNVSIGENPTRIYRIIQSYANVTFVDMTFDSTNQLGGEDCCLSFNNGTVTFSGNTSIKSSNEDVIAFDVYYWASGYPNGTTVTFDETYCGTIDGVILYDTTDSTKATLVINGTGSGTFGGVELSSDASSLASPAITITSGTFGNDVTAYLDESLTQDDNGKVVAASAVAKIGENEYYSLKSAIAAAKASEEASVTITLIADAKTTETIEWSQATPALTIDLNGYNITKTESSTSGNTFDVFQGTFTLTGTGTVYNLNGTSALRIKGATEDTADYTVVTVNSNVTLSANYAMFVTTNGGHAYGVVANIYGTLEGSICGFYLNGAIGDTTGNVPIINVKDDAVIEVTTEGDGDGIYAAGYAKYNIGAATISGGTGIEIRAGVLTVDGATITGTGSPASSEAQGSGSTTLGAGIAIVQHSTGLETKVTVNSGTISGVYAIYEANTQGNSDEAYANVSVSLAGGSYTGTEAAVYGTEGTTYTTGGTYSSDVSAYCVDGYKASDSASSGIYSIVAADPVATIGETNYYSLAKAFAAATEGDTITLIADVTLTSSLVYSNENSVTLDFDGHTITFAYDSNGQYNGETLSDGAWGLKVAAGTLTLTDSSTDADGGIVTADENTYVDPVGASAGATLIINSGYYYTNSIYEAVVYATGTDTTVNITGGTFENSAEYYQYDGGTPLVLNLGNSSTAKFVVSGGTFIGRSPAEGDDYSSTENGSTFVDGDYAAVETSDGVYTVLEAVAAVYDADGAYVNAYKTLAEAISSTSGGTVVLLKDVEVSTSISISNSVTLDLNGNTITASATLFKVASGVTLTVTDSGEDGTVNISSDSTSAVYFASGAAADSTVKISGGTINVTDTSTGKAALIWAASVDISGGTFTVTGSSDAHGIYAKGGSISGGYLTVTADSSAVAASKLVSASSGVSGIMTGGTYNVSPETYLLASGYSVQTNEDETYTVVDKNVVTVTINGNTTYYTSILSALAAANSAESDATITLLADIDLATSLTIKNTSSNTITLDLNGYTITTATESFNGSSVLFIKTPFTLTDTSDEGDGSLVVESSTIVNVIENYTDNGSTVTLSGGTISFTSTRGNATTAVIKNGSSGTVIMNEGAVITATKSEADGSASGTKSMVGISSTSGTITLNGGTITVSCGIGDATGISSSSDYLASVTVTDGAVIDVSSTAGNASGIFCAYVNMDSGSVKATSTSGTAYGIYGKANSEGTSSSVSGGTVMVSGSTNSCISGTISLTGGTYSHSDVKNWVDTEYYAVYTNSDATYTVASASVVAVVTTSDSTTTGYYTSLAEAVAAVEDNGTITLLANVTLADDASLTDGKLNIESGKTFTLDLGGYTLTGRVNIKAGEVTIQNGYMENSGGQALNVYASGDSSNPTVVTVAESLTIQNCDYGLCVFGLDNSANATGLQVTVNGSVSGTSGIFVNGNMHTCSSDNTVDYIIVNGTVSGGSDDSTVGTDCAGIAINGAANVIINSGATVSGATGIEVRAGSLTVNDGATVSAKVSTFDKQTNSNGSTTVGAGIAVIQHTTNLPITVTINGGEISGGQYALYEEDIEDTTSTNDISITISGGTFTGSTGYCVYAADADDGVIAISGGSFTEEVASAYCATGFVPATLDEASGTYTVEEGTFAASITDSDGKTTNYTTLQAAVNAASSGDTITLLKDVTEDVVIPSTASVTIDLAGNKITNVSSHTITNNGTLTITDSTATSDSCGTIDNVTHAKAAIYNEVGAECTILAGNFTRSKEASTSSTNNGGNSYYTILNHGTMTIGSEGGNNYISVSNTGLYSSMIENGWQNGAQNTTGAASTLNIYGGTFTGGLYNVKNDDYGVLNIYDGTFSGKNNILSWNVLTISGGEFTSTNMGIYTGYGDDTMDQGTTTIKGGTFTSDGRVLNVYNGGTYAVSGGSFNQEVLYEYCADGFIPTSINEETGMYTVEEGSYVASITTTDEDGDETTAYYTTLAAAASAATAGDTIVLLADIDLESSYVTISTDLTLDLNGYDITSTASCALNITSTVTLTDSSEEGEYGTISDLSTSSIAPVYSTSTSSNITVENITITSYYDAYAAIYTSGTVTVTSGTLFGWAGIYASGATVNINGGTITGYAHGIYAVKGAVVTVTDGTITYNSEGTYSAANAGVSLVGSSSYEQTKLYVKGGTITGYGYGIATAGNASNNYIEVTDGTISGKYGLFLAAVDSETTISGGTITGSSSGVEIRAGSLSVTGGTISSTYETLYITENGSGTTVAGAGIAISQHTTNDDIDVNITGGTISGYYGVFEINTVSGNTSSVGLTISGDTAVISGNSSAAALYSVSLSGTVDNVATYYDNSNTTFAVSGGHFSSEVKEAYCAEDYAPYTETSGTYYDAGVPYTVSTDIVTLGRSEDETTVPATIASGEGTATMYALVTGENISSYYTDSNYPTTSLIYTDSDGNEHNYIFAGWYSAADESSAMTSFPTGDAYAKFVDADVLTAKCIVTTVDEATRWRFMTSLDTLYFIGVGFEVKDSNGNDVSLSKTTISKTSLNVTSITPNIRTYATDFSSASTRVVTAYFDDADNSEGVTYTVTPYWTTGDGTKVTGATASFTYKGTNGSITADSAE